MMLPELCLEIHVFWQGICFKIDNEINSDSK